MRCVTSKDYRGVLGSKIERDSQTRTLPLGTQEGFEVNESSVHSK